MERDTHRAGAARQCELLQMTSAIILNAPNTQRLAHSSLQQYIPKELIEYGDFRGLLLADLDENTVIKNQVVTDQFKSTSRVNQLKIKTMYRPNSSNSAYTVVRRPPSFQMLKGAYDTHEKSADVIMLEKNIQVPPRTPHTRTSKHARTHTHTCTTYSSAQKACEG